MAGQAADSLTHPARGTPERPLRELVWSELRPADRAALLDRARAIFDPGLRERVGEIIAAVRAEGDAAVARALRDFDHCDVPADRLRVRADEFAAARQAVPGTLLDALRDAIDHVRRYNEHQQGAGDWRQESEPGLLVGEQVAPIASAGLFVPSGKASYPSVLVQLGTPALVAGVPRVAVVVPPVPGSAGTVDPAVLVVAEELGITEVFRVNGPAGIAALAFGTESIPRVRKVLGPGSPAVTCAQVEVQRYGCVTTMLLGPSESLVLADDSADPLLLAADLLNEAEHGPDSSSVLVTDSRALLDAVQGRVAERLAALPEPRREYAATALGANGGAVIVADLDEGIEVANDYAPEHMVLVVRDEEAVLPRLRYAGEILLGQSTPIAAGNFLIGCPASLPTGRFARVSSGVTAETFRRRTAIARADDRALRRMAPSIVALAEHEGFPAHAAAVAVRTERPPAPTAASP